MNIETITVGPLATNCYVVIDDSGETAILIDPGAEPDRIIARINSKQVLINTILLTHGHADHIGAVPELKDELRAKVMIHKADAHMLKSAEYSLGVLFGVSHTRIKPDIAFSNSLGEYLGDFGWNFELVETPGHSLGSVCYYLPREGVLFSGDTLFANGVGRTDLAGGDRRALLNSLGKIKQLPANTMVYPGHGPQFRLGNRFKPKSQDEVKEQY